MTQWILPDGSRIACSIERCEKPVLATGLCSSHYQRRYTYGHPLFISLEYGPCAIEDCTSNANLRKVHGLCPKHYKLCWRYGLEPGALIALHLNRRCENPACGSTENLHIDHDHSCCAELPACGGCVRGWLCSGCNKALGYLQDDPEKLRGLADFLESRG